MGIKLLINNNAKKTIRNITKELDVIDKLYIKSWLNESKAKCFIISENELIKAFVLLHKCDYDPLNIHDKLHLIDLIYTFPPYRRNNLACALLLYIKERNNTHSALKSDELIPLFEKAGYVRYPDHGTGMPMFRNS